MTPLPLSGRCPCGSETLTLARDMTEFTTCEFVDGKFVLGGAYLEPTNAPESVRLFCPDCGEYYQVPEGL